MKQQILVIHGGDAYETEEEYVHSLLDMEVSLEPKVSDWKSNLQEDLGEDFAVYAPRFPNPQNARYEEWKIIFEKYLELLTDPILIGHSLGGIFLAKYATEETFMKPVKAIFLVAAPYSTAQHEPIPGFMLSGFFDALRMMAGKIYLYHSRDDIVVPYESLEMFTNALPDATATIFEDRGHFNLEHIPELVTDIRELIRSS